MPITPQKGLVMPGALAILSGLLIGIAAEVISRRRRAVLSEVWAGQARLRVVQGVLVKRHGQDFGLDDPALL
jgi:hypothetical protein